MNGISSSEEKVTPQYVFGHNVMPLYLGKEDFIQEFLSSALQAVNKLWYITHESLTGNPPPCHLELVTAKLPNSMIAFVTKYPEPVKYIPVRKGSPTLRGDFLSGRNRPARLCLVGLNPTSKGWPKAE